MVTDQLLPHLFRQEYSRMTAVLCRHFGLQHIETAEDIISDTFLKATEVWQTQGVPLNPVAWLYTVAKNKAKDHLRRRSFFELRIRDRIKPEETETAPEFEFTGQEIADSQLAMIFAVCNPVIGGEAQICLALQVLCSFSVEEIADAFLSKTETIKKRLLRARACLRNDNFQIDILRQETIQSRLDNVLRTLYLLFNEGYASRSGNVLIRKELCAEALRLTLVLTGNPMTNTTRTSALLALFCYQSSRLDARENEAGDMVSFEEQDRSLWDQELIDKGNYYLVNACTGSDLSKYHLEAGIAYWHTTPTDPHQWDHILQLYNELILIEYSPVTALNRTFAFSKVYGAAAAIPEAEKLNLEGNSHYYALLGYLYSGIQRDKAVVYYNKAIGASRSVAERKILTAEISKPGGSKSEI